MCDYLNSLIYKLECKDGSSNHVYIGSTTNLKTRMYIHKSKCNNQNDKAYNNHKYKYIRNHGGWDNWESVILELYPCNDKSELHNREQYHLNKFQLNLNQYIPGQTKKQYYKKNIEIIQMKKKEKFECVCGGKYTRNHKARHLKSIMHKGYLNTFEQLESDDTCPSDSENLMD